MAEATKVGDFYGLLGMRVDKGSFSAATKILGAVKAGIAAFVGFKLVQGAVHAVEQVVELGGKLADASQKTGVAAETLQEWGFAAKLAGSSLDEVIGALGKLNKNLNEAATKGTGNAADGFKLLGISLQDPAVKAQNLDEILLMVADKFKDMKDGPKKVAAAMELFGKTGANLIPTLNQGREGLVKLKKEARELGIVIDEETVKSLDEFGDDVDKVKEGWRGFKTQAVLAIIPLLKDLMPGLIEQMKELVTWVREHKEEIAEFAATLGRGLKNAAIIVVTAIQIISVVFKAVGTAIGVALAWIVIKIREARKAVVGAFEVIGAKAKAAGDIAMESFSAIEDFFVTIATGIRHTWEDLVTFVVAKIADIQKAMFDAAKAIANNPLGKIIFGDGLDPAINAIEASGAPQGGDIIRERARVTRENESRVKQGLAPLAVPELPSMSAPAPSGTVGGASIVNSVSVAVTAAPGMDERALAIKVGQVVDERLTAVFRNAQDDEGLA